MTESEKSVPVNGEGSDQKNTEEKPIHIKFTGVRGIKRCVQNDNGIQWSEYRILGFLPPINASTSSTLRTPKLGNTILHKAAWQGNDGDVVKFVSEFPHLLFELNENKDTPLHVAARAGKIDIIKKLLEAYADFRRPEIAMAWLKYSKSSKPVEDYDAEMNMEDLLGLVRMGNKEGNTVLHEAIYGNNILGLVFKAFEPYTTKSYRGESLAESCFEYALEVENNAQRSVLYLEVEVGDREVVKLVLDKCPVTVEPKGLSPFVPAIMKQKIAMLKMILEKRSEWIHLEDQNGRILLHYAAFRGFLEGVRLIIGKCPCCVFRTDQDGFFPIHLAAYGGHVKVVKELLNHCNDPAEMLDNDQRNILHIAAKNGNHAVVYYILKNRNLVDLINQKDYYGDTPLHLATSSCHPKTVYYLTWNRKVDLNLQNFKGQCTPLDIINGIFHFETEPISSYQLEKGSDREQLTWIALKSAGAESHTIVSPVDSKNKASQEKVSEPTEGYSKRIENLSVISTLIITASVAACLAVPGEADGKAHNLKKSMFQVFIICITISLFSSIIATIILLWTRIGLTELVTFSISIVTQLIGVALFTLSLAFMAGLFTVVSELPWLAYVFLGLCVIFIVVGSLLYAFLFFPSTSTSSNKVIRWISYYPFIILATFTERKYY